MKVGHFFQRLHPRGFLSPFDEYTLGSWLRIPRSNWFIIPFTIVAMLLYTGLTKGSDRLALLSSGLVGLPLGYLVALIETHAIEFQRVCRRRQFSTFLLLKTFRLAVLFSLLFTILLPIFVLLDFRFHYSLFNVALSDFLQNKFFELLGVSLLVAGVANFFVEINRKLGPGVLLHLITGRYYRPEPQLRTFLFLDIKNSTTLAEEMGDVKFSQFLQDFFYDISDTITKHGGEIYQYVGDEVVVLWKHRPGRQDNATIRCFLAIGKRIQALTEYYQRTYGFVPTFKGGIHRGPVVIAEVGKVKSEIAYHGDVLNTTARILDLCRTLAHDLLISTNVFENLAPEPSLTFEPMGNFYLKGKSRSVTVYAVEQNLAPASKAVQTTTEAIGGSLSILDKPSEPPTRTRVVAY